MQDVMCNGTSAWQRHGAIWAPTNPGTVAGRPKAIGYYYQILLLQGLIYILQLLKLILITVYMTCDFLQLAYYKLSAIEGASYTRYSMSYRLS